MFDIIYKLSSFHIYSVSSIFDSFLCKLINSSSYALNSCLQTLQREAVEVSNISFIDIHGSSTRKVPIQLECSESVACTDIVLDDVQLTSEDRQEEVSSSCINAHGVSKNVVSPDVPCLLDG